MDNLEKLLAEHQADATGAPGDKAEEYEIHNNQVINFDSLLWYESSTYLDVYNERIKAYEYGLGSYNMTAADGFVGHTVVEHSTTGGFTNVEANGIDINFHNESRTDGVRLKIFHASGSYSLATSNGPPNTDSYVSLYNISFDKEFEVTVLDTTYKVDANLEFIGLGVGRGADMRTSSYDNILGLYGGYSPGGGFKGHIIFEEVGK